MASYATEMTRRNFRRELDADLVEFDVKDGAIPPAEDYDGFVVTGSAASVYWEEDWITATEDWLRSAIDRGLPGLGVCYGHQLVASALGGTVEPMDDYELGYREIELVGETPIFAGLGNTVLAFASHSDTVTELPPGAELTAENDRGIQGFRIGDVFTVQFHPEYDMDSARRVARAKDLPDERIQQVVDGVTEDNYAQACETKRLFDAFVAHVSERATPSPD